MFFRTGLPNLVNLAATAAVALAVVYFQKWRIELPVRRVPPPWVPPTYVRLFVCILVLVSGFASACTGVGLVYARSTFDEAFLCE